MGEREREIEIFGDAEFDSINWRSDYEQLIEEFPWLAPKVSHEHRWTEGYDPLPSQLRYHECDARYKGFSGPVGSGKSLALVRESLKLAYGNPGRLGLVGAPTYRMLEDVTMLTFLEVLETWEIPFSLRKSRKMITLKDTKSRVIFRSLEHPHRLVGTNLAWFACDELTFCKQASWEKLEARLRDPLAKLRAGIAVWTANGFDWVYDRFIKSGHPDKYIGIRAQPFENKYLPDDYYENLKASYDPLLYRQEVLGEYLSLFSGMVYHAFRGAQDKEGNVRSVEYDPRLPICWSMDFNVRRMCSVIAQQKTDAANKTVFNVLDELVLPDSNTVATCNEFDERIEKLVAPHENAARGKILIDVRVYGDAAGNSGSSKTGDLSDYTLIRDFFKRRADRYRVTYHVPDANPTVKSRVNAVNSALCDATGERRLFIAPHCKELATDFEQVAWAVNSSTDIDKKKDAKRTHISDALGYLVAKVAPILMRGGERNRPFAV